MTSSTDVLEKLSTLETQLAHCSEKVKMRENVILQLEEEIKAKERLIFEQSHLINILESDNGERFDADSIASDSEITIIEKHMTSRSPSKSESPTQECERLRDKMEQIMIDRERLEVQNEQLLKQWEDALEYVTKVQKQLQEEMRRNNNLKTENLELMKVSHDTVVIPKGLLQMISVFILFCLLLSVQVIIGYFNISTNV